MMLMTLINDLLDLAKHEKLTFQLHKSYFDLTRTVENVFKTLEFLSIKKKIKTEFKVATKDLKYFVNLYGDE